MKRWLALSLIWALLLGLLPTTAFAATTEQTENPWEGKSAVFVGDSITYGSRTKKIYYQYLKTSLGLSSTTSVSVGGCSISATSDYGHTKQPLIDKYLNIPAADLIVVFLGSNDYGHESVLGTAADTTDVSFYGALNVILPAMVEAYPSSKIVFATPLHRYGFGNSKITGETYTYDSIPNGRGAALGDYVAVLKEACATYGVSVIDLYEEYPLDPSDEAVRTQYMNDGLHPNADGHKMIADIMEQHIRTYTPVEAEPEPEPEPEPEEETELIYGNKFAAGYSQTNRACSRRNYYLTAGTKITFKHTDTMQWACARTSNETSTNRLNYFPDSAWSDRETAVVAADSWVGFAFKYRDESQVYDLTIPLSYYITIEPPHTHTYQNGVCTGCGEKHPTLVNYEGKVISILGDSISTFAGYIPVADGFNLEHLPRYPQDNLLTDVNETWWMQAISGLGAKLGINDSWRGATVSGAAPVTTGTTGENASFANLTRIQNLGSNGTPDVIFVYGGTNDLAHVSKVGSFDPNTAPATADLTTEKWDNLADGYVHVLLRLRHFYPDAQIVCLLPTYTKSYYSNTKLAQANEVLAAICTHYGVPYTDLRNCGIATTDLPDGIHPNATGMDYITTAVLETLQNTEGVVGGENVVHSVTHKLTGATASLSYYKGVTHGKSFVATISGDQLTVTVTMGGIDVTADCYADGVITIPAVTGDLVITATGYTPPIYADYLLALPDRLCSSTNLWPLLEHNREYYTVDGWGVHTSGKVRSITFPVTVGDRIWATSFQAAGANGTTINGIRLTWFDEYNVLQSMSPAEVYAEFETNGYLTAPEGAVAVNVVMWNDNASNEVYLLNRDHAYDHVYDATCNGCGEEREVAHPLSFGGKSVSEDVSGLAFKFDVAVQGMTANRSTAIYDNATVDGYRLLSMGAIVTNGVSTTDIPCVYLWSLEEDACSFAVRVKNIPTDQYDTLVTATPYMILEMDGVAVTVYGEAQTYSYNDAQG